MRFFQFQRDARGHDRLARKAVLRQVDERPAPQVLHHRDPVRRSEVHERRQADAGANGGRIVAAGADTLVAGSAVFSGGNYAQAIAALRVNAGSQ